MDSTALTRLRRDYLEWQRVSAGCPGISCAPLDDNMFEWHGNLVGGHHYKSVGTLHIVIKFAQDYPTRPPSVKLCTYIPHSNIIPHHGGGCTLCIDMLGFISARPHEGWSSAYSVTSVLLQLQVFLFDEWVDQSTAFTSKLFKNALWDRVLEEGSGQRTPEEVDKKLGAARKHALEFSCPCGHTGANPWPPVAPMPRSASSWICSRNCHVCRSDAPAPALARGPVPAPARPASTRRRTGTRAGRRADADPAPARPFAFLGAPSPMRAGVVAFLEGPQLVNLAFVCRDWRRAACADQALARLETVCFHTKLSAEDAVLGIGLKVVRHDDGNLKEVQAVLDVVSDVAWEKGVRKGVWGDSFDTWLPLALDREHLRKALPLAERALARVATNKPDALFEPWMALAVLPQAMNSFVVSLMNAAESGVKRHASERALWGYGSLHHLLLALAEKHVRLRQLADYLVGDFVRGEAARSKHNCADLGQFLMLLTVAPRPWAEVVEPVLMEAAARNVLWVDRARTKPLERMSAQEWFDATKTSKRLLMFQAFFLRLSTDLVTYNRRFGHPTEAQQSTLVNTCRAIPTVNSWPGFFARVGARQRDPHAVMQELCDAVARSAKLGYHGASAKGKGKGKGAARGPERVGWIARLRAAADARDSIFAAEECAFRSKFEAATKKAAAENAAAENAAAEKVAAEKVAAEKAAAEKAAAEKAAVEKAAAEKAAAEKAAADKAAADKAAASTPAPASVSALTVSNSTKSWFDLTEDDDETPLIPSTAAETPVTTAPPTPAPASVAPTPEPTLPGALHLPAMPAPPAPPPVMQPVAQPAVQKKPVSEWTAAGSKKNQRTPAAAVACYEAAKLALKQAAVQPTVPTVVEPSAQPVVKAADHLVLQIAPAAPEPTPNVEVWEKPTKAAKAKKQSPPQETSSLAFGSGNPFASLDGEAGVDAAAAEKRLRNVTKKLRDARLLEGKADLSSEQQAKVARIAALEEEAAALDAVVKKFAASD